MLNILRLFFTSMVLKDRQKSILDAVIQEYIETAHPVASRGITRKFRFSVSPATIRNEMGELDELGYLEQPHTSAGRIPTDKGYRFFVDGTSDKEAPDQNNSRRMSYWTSIHCREAEEFFHDATKIIAELTHSFAVFGMPARHNFEKSGFSEIMREPEFTDMEFIREFGELADEFEDAFESFFRELDQSSAPRAFIGSENPIHSAWRCGVVVSRMPVPEDQDGFLALIGPKRMDYRKNISLIGELQNYARKYAKQ